MTYAYHCSNCDADGMWRAERRGDVVTCWACPTCLSQVCTDLQRDHEVTELIITHAAKAAEWTAISRTLQDTLPVTVCLSGTCQRPRGHTGLHRDATTQWGPPVP